MDLLPTLLILCPGYFLAGFADSVAGGGGIISVPVAMLSGMPIHTVYGTNKFAMSLGTSMSLFKYGRSGVIPWRTAGVTALAAAIAAALGARAALSLSERMLSYSLIVLLPLVSILIFLNKDFGTGKAKKQLSPRRAALYAALIGGAMGFYDGFFGPGAGTLYIMLFSSIFGYDLLTSTGLSKAGNLASNIGAMITFLLDGKVWLLAGIPAALCAILGNYIGSSLAIKNGARIIRPIVIVMICLLFAKVLLDLL